MIGLSGLLVKSAQQMVATAEDLRTAGIEVPILVGGAALSRKFTENRIAHAYGGPVIYCRDAMDGLEVAHRLMDPARREALLAERARRGTAAGPAAAPPPVSAAPVPVWREVEVPTPPDLDLHVLDKTSHAEVYRFLNPQMLYAKHLGLRGSVQRLRERGDVKTAKLEETVEALKTEAAARGLLAPRALYQFFAAWSEGDEVVLADRPGGMERARFSFPRQTARDRLCLADWVAPRSAGRADYLAAFVTTAGGGVRDQAEQWKAAGEYLKSYALQALAIESAEAMAELVHRTLRGLWGFPDPPGLSDRELFQARYRGIRVSFGYPACPNLEDQAQLWRLLEPDRRIGVQLTDGFMMEPEASVSALVFHHPDARYFAAGESAITT
jgi:5-methyltetrahydrofolate--homocysteine methyltransferase